MPSVTMGDVAVASGLSRATVSLALRGSPQIPELTKQRVREAMDRLGYIYDRRAAVMRTERTMTIGLVVTDIRNPYFAEVEMALDAVMHEAGYAVLQGYSRDDQEREQRLLRELAEHRVDGVVLIPSKETRSVHLNRLAALGIPMVLIARRVPGQETDYVGVNNVMAGRLLGEHLAGQGCRRVAFLGGPSRSTARAERQRGLAAGLRRHGVSFEPRLAIPTSADRKGGVNAVTALLQRGALPEGIVCYSDVVAFGVLSGLRAAGVEPGWEVAVASFDDIAEARLQHPALTSVATYPDLAGTEAARLLLGRFEEPEAKPRRVLLKPRLHVRASSTTRSTTSPSLGEGKP